MGLRTLRSAATLVVAGLIVLATHGTGHADPSTDRQRQLAAAWQALEGVIERYNAVRDDLRSTNAQLARVNARLAPLRGQVDAAQRAADELARALYRSGAMGSTAALIGADSPETLMDQLATLDHLERGRTTALNALKNAQRELGEERYRLDRLQLQQKAQEAELGARKATIESQLKRMQNGRARMPRGALVDGYRPVFTDDAAGRAVKYAYDQLGKVYQWGADGPDSYDCSGLTMAAWKAAGVVLPHNAARQKQTVTPIKREELRPGDLVFYYKDVSHVGLYIGDGRVIEAPRTGERISMRLLDYAPIVGYGRPDYTAQ
ncbi:NlpC/P60 family protein [Dactylosporangium sp. AC04546]|uniref:C40 family peptidase n=1 Tax=Dactylosporangium sp. AC04546 TaxID=2862460 RepID=UPI001EDFDC29|nr:C40 family peptidase [Dactylosporangium sp. AC04546]WVK83266.1 NlpC/P60 family protein [Dactylosporangium sp. AC04546]